MDQIIFWLLQSALLGMTIYAIHWAIKHAVDKDDDNDKPGRLM
jgi:hypothetical protein